MMRLGVKRMVIVSSVMLAAVLWGHAAEPLLQLSEPIAVTTGLSDPWSSDTFALEADGYYRISVVSKGVRDAMMATRYRDAEGDLFVVDNYNRVVASEDWEETTWYFQLFPGVVSGDVVVAAGSRAPFHVKSIEVQPATRAEALHYIETELAGLPPIFYDPPADRWQFLSGAKARFRNGEPIRIVMLGDSIVNDTFNSMITLMIQRQWPGANLTVIPSVRGATGCGFYQDENRVQAYVLDHEPDLVVIGGISHGYNVEPIRSVIRQIRDVQPTEFLVMTGAKAPESNVRAGFRYHLQISDEEAARRVRQFNAEIGKMAESEGAAFFDMRRAYDQYIFDSGFSPRYFMRDETHGDLRGKLVLGALLAQFLRPDAP